MDNTNDDDPGSSDSLSILIECDPIAASAVMNSSSITQSQSSPQEFE